MPTADDNPLDTPLDTRDRRLEPWLVVTVALAVVLGLLTHRLYQHGVEERPARSETVPLPAVYQQSDGLYVADIKTHVRDFRELPDAVRLFEDGVEVPRIETLEDALRPEGSRGFFPGGIRLILRTGDGSDPRSNGRVYTLRRPVRFSPKLFPSLLRATLQATALSLALLLWLIWRRRLRWLPVAGRLALVVTGFLLAALALRLLTPPPTDWLLWPKLQALEERLDEVDVLFLGSSRVYRQLSPELFTQLTAERGEPLRAFNFGVQSMRLLEADAILRRLLSREPQRLRLVVIECEPQATRLEERNALTSRVVLWHDPVATWRGVELTLDRPFKKPEKRLQLALRHLRSGLFHISNLGRLRTRLDQLLAPPGTDLGGGWRLGPTADGFLDLDLELRDHTHPTRLTPIKRRRQAFLDGQPAYEEKVRALAEGLAPIAPHAEDLALLGRLQRSLDEHGVAVRFLVGPILAERPAVLEAARRGAIAPPWSYNDPDRYPELYLPEHRFDEEHLNARGAEIFTTMITATVLETLSTEATPGG